MMDYNQFPLGMEYAFAVNRADKDKFMDMSDDEKKEYIERNRSAMSRQELDELMQSLGEEEDDGPDLEDVSGIFKGPGIG